jgi:Sodium:neurotransmitter symporter family
VPCGVGVMSAYASFAPATTNIWVDNNCICAIDCFTSLFAGFAVFSILGNMAHQQRSIAGASPDLRQALCTQNVLNLQCPADCALCGEEDWMSLPQSSCCGKFETRNVAQGSFILAFSVRTKFQFKQSTDTCSILVMKLACLHKRLCAR